MKIAYLGAGAWGFALASLLAQKGHQVVCWSIIDSLVETINSGKPHPALDGAVAPPGLILTNRLEVALEKADLIVESVTSKGMRPVFEKLKEHSLAKCPIILTSKGIEQDTGLILPDVAIEVLGEAARFFLGVISGPSFAADVIRDLPTSVVGAAYDPHIMEMLCHTFSNETFRVYPNPDVLGVCLGGALKNVIAIACGIAEGLNLGDSARAALMTRGLHEMQKLAVACGAKKETLYGLSGMGDLCLTANSMTSRNFRFGNLIAKGVASEDAVKSINMAVEGAYTAKSALQLSQKHAIPMPITEAIHAILYEGHAPDIAARSLMMRPIKEEVL